jgi:hypothetical protein
LHIEIDARTLRKGACFALPTQKIAHMLNRLLERVPVVLLGLLVCSCSEGGNDSDPNDNAFKTASVDYAVAGAGVTNILALPFTAPEKASAWVSATGTCGVVEPLPIRSVLAAQIETEPTARDPSSGDALFELGGAGAAPTQGSFSATRALAVTAGLNTVYLNIDNPSTGGMMYCSATMMVLFGNRQLQ